MNAFNHRCKMFGARLLTSLLVLSACTERDTPTGLVRQKTPAPRPSFYIDDEDDPCFGGAGWCHIWGDASMDSGYTPTPTRAVPAGA
jgi:hypothetical protein